MTAVRRAFSLFRSTVGQKIVMAVTGLVLVLFVVGHMLGNLKAFQGAEKLDGYAEFLREVGEPVFGRGQLLWLVRLVLVAAAVLHVTAALELTRRSRAARPEGYVRPLVPEASTVASRSMRWGGLALVLFVVYHLLHFTFGSVHPDFVAGRVYHNVVVAFQSPVVTGVYVAAMGALGLHLWHGVWSALQTLGVNHPRYNGLRRVLAIGLAVVVAGGFVLVPLAIFAGAIR